MPGRARLPAPAGCPWSLSFTREPSSSAGNLPQLGWEWGGGPGGPVAPTSSQGPSTVLSRSGVGRQGLQEEPRTPSLVGFSVFVALAELGAAGQPCLGAGMMIRGDGRGMMIRVDRIKEASAPLELHPYGAFQPALSARGSPQGISSAIYSKYPENPGRGIGPAWAQGCSAFLGCLGAPFFNSQMWPVVCSVLSPVQG